ncbi:hypothetical protein ALI144C_03085 [Actinosynnema sp. ALI-1.44]|uniref:YciI family protein n=1 Tax=Actinosynnema sp. ALI-1.44 TaxID=1933779 RepID=UPI00097BAF8E|nr:YciI family protein [Actinosynnema sp. ALI-1.44]ONI90344.1 hypothetical protein ALI144C_03085 [Actinosynnema sp. ALI-1.44]
MPQYAFLIYENEIPIEDIPADVMAANLAAPEKIEAMGARIVSEYPMQPGSTATTLQKGGAITDGPFIEGKETIAGFFVVECRDLDQAIAIGKLLPIMDGGIEIRPLHEM